MHCSRCISAHVAPPPAPPLHVTRHLASSGGHVLGSPFRCCVLPDFLVPAKEGGLEELREELLKLKFHPKNNDLYQFSQVCCVGVGACRGSGM